ncbi:MAG TPA: VOC family protein [Segeticoccus sp.]|uniref:VOC family protein n=1 Tax=Segeticoccus sp. TaxID=2706531 RepID=UPI002D80EB9D|nr:VOC family protein [Segeticoccus sp.]HET8599852.1 VOC family protein [Segeticoccus sp.]
MTRPVSTGRLVTEDEVVPGHEGTVMSLITCLWFDGEAEEAAQFYTSVFPDSRITGVTHNTDAAPGENGAVLTVEFEVNGQQFVGLNGGPAFSFSEAISFQVMCKDQAEVDRYWAILSEGGQEGPCGWLKDRYGLSWQVVPAVLPQLLNDPDRGRADRAMKAMMGMGKLDIAGIAAAADGEPAPAL